MRVPPPSPWAQVVILWRRNDVAAALAVAVAAKLAMLLLAALLLDWPSDFWGRMAWKWDGEHYLRAAQHGFAYPAPDQGPTSVHFAFLYPMVIRFFGSSEAAALLINNVASLGAVAVVALHLGRRPAMFLALFPSWIVYGTVAYSEGLYVLLAALALWAWDTRRFEHVAGLAAGLAAMTRFIGGPALAVASLPWSRWNPVGRWTAWQRWTGAIVLGACGVGLWVYLLQATGASAEDYWCGYCVAQRNWGGELVWPWQHFDYLLHGWFTNQNGGFAQGNLGPFDYAIRDLLFIVPFVWGLALLWRRPEPGTLFAYAGVVLLTAITTSGTPAAALPRYILVGFPAIAILGTRLASRGAWLAYGAAGVVLGAHGLAHHLFSYWS